MKVALIFGITGQDGSYLANFLLKKKYIVHGIKRKSSSINTDRIDYLYENKKIKNFYIHYGDLADSLSIQKIISKISCANTHYNTQLDIITYGHRKYTDQQNNCWASQKISFCFRFFNISKFNVSLVWIQLLL